MGSGKLILGLLAGAATGTVLGILFAPQKGAKTRKKISKTGVDYADSVKKHFNEFIDNVSQKYEQAEEKVSDFTENLKTNSVETEKDKGTTKS